MPHIPDPELISDMLQAALLKPETSVVLALGVLPGTVAPTVICRSTGPIIIRYGLEYLQRDAVLIPGLFAAEYGGILVGREAWDYTVQHSTLHPRADLLGLRSDGVEDQVRLRDLDLGRPAAVLAYESADARLPLARLDGYWLGPEAPPVPDLLQATLPRLEALPAACYAGQP